MISNVIKSFNMKSSRSLFQATHRLWTGIIDKSKTNVKNFSHEFLLFSQFAEKVRFIVILRFFMFLLISNFYVLICPTYIRYRPDMTKQPEIFTVYCTK